VTDGLPLRCPCGAPAPEPLPAPGRRPVPCGACGAPLVAPGRVEQSALETGGAAAALAAVGAAFAWVLVARRAESGAPWVIPAGALAVAGAVRLGARARSSELRWIAVGAWLVFLVLGELLLFRHALLPRLVAMHAAEHAADPASLGADEHRAMTWANYLHIELGIGWWAAVGLSVAVLWRVLRPLPAVPAFASPRPAAAPAPGAEPQRAEADPAPAS
jgi:hypothetical protein